MNFNLIAIVLAVTFLLSLAISRRRVSSRELSRFRGQENDLFKQVSAQLNTTAASLADKKNTIGQQAEKSSDPQMRKMHEAGLESPEAKGKFMLFRIACIIAGPCLGAVSYLYIIPYYATLLTLTCSAAGILLPMFWLKARAANRTEDIQRELPLVLDLVNLGTSAGWDVVSALEHVIDTLYLEFPEHPLIRELKKSRWLVASGCTWDEGLTRLANRLGDDTVRRTTLALGQAIRQGGDRSSQLEGIAQDAQRSYYSSLDKRLAALPVKALLVTMMLMISYFMILLTPAAVQVKNIIMKG